MDSKPNHLLVQEIITINWTLTAVSRSALPIHPSPPAKMPEAQDLRTRDSIPFAEQSGHPPGRNIQPVVVLPDRQTTRAGHRVDIQPLQMQLLVRKSPRSKNWHRRLQQ